MRTVFFISVLFLSLGTLFSQQAEALDHLQRMQASFAREDARSFADAFTEDAVFISPVGTICNSRPCIYQSHKAYFEAVEVMADPVYTNEVIRFTELTEGRYELVVRFIAENETEGETYSVAMQLIQGSSGWLVHTMQMTPVQPLVGGQ